MNLYELYPSNSSDLLGLVRKYDLNCIIKASKERQNDEKNYPPQTLVTDEKVVHVCTEDEDHSFYIFEFPGYYYQISNYTLQTGEKWVVNGLYPVHWKIEGYTGNKWIKLDEIDHPNPGLNTKKTQTFRIQNTQWFKRIKITHIGKAYSEKGYNFCLYKTDFFGMLIKDNIFNSIRQRTIIKHIPYSYIKPLTIIFLLNS